MATYVVSIPDFLPASLNVLLRMHWRDRRRTLRAESDLVAISLLQARVPPAHGRRRVSLTFSAPGGSGAKTGDADNRLKGLLDALVKWRALKDDSPAWCELGEIRCLAGPKGTLITLEDLGP